MTESGWDIPGIPRDLPPGDAATGQPAAPSAGPAGSAAGARSGSRGRRRVSSVSAAAGSSAGPFARSAGAAPPPAAASSDPSAASTAGLFSAGPAVPAGAPVAAASAAGPRDAAQALAYLSGALEFLAHDDPAGWGEGLQADCLRALAVAESRQTAAHAKVLAAFSVPGGGLAGDGHRSPRVWLSWQTQATRRAAGVQVGWMHLLRERRALTGPIRLTAGDGTRTVTCARWLRWHLMVPGCIRRLPIGSRSLPRSERFSINGDQYPAEM